MEREESIELIVQALMENAKQVRQASKYKFNFTETRKAIEKIWDSEENFHKLVPFLSGALKRKEITSQIRDYFKSVWAPVIDEQSTYIEFENKVIFFRQCNLTVSSPKLWYELLPGQFEKFNGKKSIILCIAASTDQIYFLLPQNFLNEILIPQNLIHIARDDKEVYRWKVTVEGGKVLLLLTNNTMYDITQYANNFEQIGIAMPPFLRPLFTGDARRNVIIQFISYMEQLVRSVRKVKGETGGIPEESQDEMDPDNDDSSLKGSEKGILMYWKEKNLQEDLERGFEDHFNSRDPRLHKLLEKGDNVFIICGVNKGGVLSDIKLLAHLIVKDKEVTPGYEYGDYRIWADQTHLYYFDLETNASVLPILNKIQTFEKKYGNNATNWSRALQSIREINNPEDVLLLKEFGDTLKKFDRIHIAKPEITNISEREEDLEEAVEEVLEEAGTELNLKEKIVEVLKIEEEPLTPFQIMKKLEEAGFLEEKVDNEKKQLPVIRFHLQWGTVKPFLRSEGKNCWFDDSFLTIIKKNAFNIENLEEELKKMGYILKDFTQLFLIASVLWENKKPMPSIEIWQKVTEKDDKINKSSIARLLSTCSHDPIFARTEDGKYSYIEEYHPEKGEEGTAGKVKGKKEVTGTGAVSEEEKGAYSKLVSEKGPKLTEKMKAMIEECVKLLDIKKQIIINGPPGTSKTFLAKQIANNLTSGDKTRQKFIQFHPEYAYENFIECLRIVPGTSEF